MREMRCVVALLVVLVFPLAAWAAPEGKVVVAQGVDPTTLDPMNHQETPAANLAVNIFDMLLERDQDLKIVPLVAESYRLVAPTIWEFKLAFAPSSSCTTPTSSTGSTSWSVPIPGPLPTGGCAWR